jgi:hypothetical protein
MRELKVVAFIYLDEADFLKLYLKHKYNHSVLILDDALMNAAREPVLFFFLIALLAVYSIVSTIYAVSISIQ